jgi:ComF family protein
MGNKFKVLKNVSSYFYDFVNLFYPYTCKACGVPLLRHEKVICTQCRFELPKTQTISERDNPLEKIFWGRVPLEAVASYYYFQKGGKVQHLIHNLKYKGHKEVGVFIGKLMGLDLCKEPVFNSIDYIVPVPLHPSKKRKRGYNQSEAIADGLAESLQKEVDIKSLIRTRASETQTRKSRFKRWENVKEIFLITDFEKLKNKHILLVDDVLTTGATIEACAQQLLAIEGIKISVATLACAYKV